MLIGEIMERLRKGEALKDIAQEIGIHKATLSGKLSALGYSYSQSTKVWSWTKEENEPLEINIHDVSRRGTLSEQNKGISRTNTVQGNTKTAQREDKNKMNNVHEKPQRRAKNKIHYYNQGIPQDLRDQLDEMSDHTSISRNQLIVLAGYALVANYKKKGSFIFADLLNPEHRE